VLAALLVVVAVFLAALLWIVSRESYAGAASLSDVQYGRFKDLSDLAWTRVERTLQYALGTILLPLLTLFVGYAFGRGSTGAGKPDPGNGNG
jgi:hypothetical protein